MPGNSSGLTAEASQPSASCPTRLSAAGARPPSQNSSLRRFGRGVSRRSVTDQKRPRTVVGSPLQSALISVIDSARRAARSSRGTPIASISLGRSIPRPPAGSSRPPESASIVASSRASRTGLRGGSTSTLVPSFRRSVRAAIAASAGSGAMPPRPAVSLSQIES